MAAVSTAAELNQALQATGTVNIEVNNNIDISTGDIRSFVIGNGVAATVNIAKNMTITGVSNIFDVQDGGSLTLTGEGTIKGTTKQTHPAIAVQGSTAKVTVDGVTIDVFSHNGKPNNYAYGIYARDGATVNMISGTIKAAYGSCISTNNTTGGGFINVRGGNLLCDGSYAIYNPAYGIIRISGGQVQGINARMGEIYISGNAKIIGTTLTTADYDDIGANINTSGCIWLGDTIALVMGTYTDPNGTDVVLEVTGEATVTSNFRAAIGTYMVDTKTTSNVSVMVDNPEKVTTNDSAFEAIKTYDHDYIAAAATAAGKTFTPKVTSSISVTTEPEEDYENMSSSDLKIIADEFNNTIKSKEQQVKATVKAVVKRAKYIAGLGGYETIIPFHSFSIPWNTKYGNDIINKLKGLGYTVEYTYYANSMTQAYGISIKWS